MFSLNTKQIKEDAMKKLQDKNLNKEDVIQEVANKLHFIEEEGYLDLYYNSMTEEEIINYLIEVYECVFGSYYKEGETTLGMQDNGNIVIYVNGKHDLTAYMQYDFGVDKNRLYEVEEDEEY